MTLGLLNMTTTHLRSTYLDVHRRGLELSLAAPPLCLCCVEASRHLPWRSDHHPSDAGTGGYSLILWYTPSEILEMSWDPPNLDIWTIQISGFWTSGASDPEISGAGDPDSRGWDPKMTHFGPFPVPSRPLNVP
jgi:hypothetical protein